MCVRLSIATLLCCALDARCGDQCRPDAHIVAQTSAIFKRILPNFIYQSLHSMVGHFLAIFIITSGIIASLFVVVYYAQKDKSHVDLIFISATMWQIYFLLLIVTGILIWLYVLAQNTMRLALKETHLQTERLTHEVEAHEETAIQLAKARDTANIANRAKSRYLSGVSHELRTPLNTIFGYAQLMEGNANTDAKSKKIATVIKRSSEHLSDVIEGLLEISKIEARKLDLHRDKVDLNALLHQLEAMFQAQALAKNIEFKVVFQNKMPYFVSVDEKRLRQILLNLLSNAIKFTHQGKVELLIQYRNQVACFVIKDTGIGIAETDQERIFEPFERVHETQTDAPQQQVSGTGLGLSISRLMIEMMGGNLTLNSQLGIGTEFTLKLFLPSVSLSRTEEENRSNQSAANINGYTGKTKHLMVVDDNPNHRNLMNDFLQPLGFIVHLAESAEQALELLPQLSIDLFLLDISMPGMDGWQLVEQLHQQGNDKPIIIISADPYTKTQIQLHKADIDAYITKPVAFEKLLHQLQISLEVQWQMAETAIAESTSSGKPSELTQVTPAEKTLSHEPDQKVLASLKKYAQIGYLNGVLESIEQLAIDNTETKWLKTLKILSEQCNLNEIVRLIDEHSLIAPEQQEKKV
ncbi:ATP-binding response regulator [sulfur-oxidizing endosymbiont of Gigantopelta aegis]|uniref:ATP-binding response regulator n=1 Tax=sulfur-oxidizing endosymbiont of Gigantopelta aegis TaxID=2794934 RepID=UPI0018DE453B|nr:ATP-binding protein [sulfur-oxidizing endosymbiont of Gigantopelta aegis]